MISTIIVCQPDHARQAVEKHLDIAWDPNAPFHHHITAPKTSIGIDQIRQLISLAKHTPPKKKIRLIWLEKADALTPQAQNALLKILEEPPAQTQIVLTTHSEHPLLPTIRSRCHIIHQKKGGLPSAPDQETTTLLKKLEQANFSQAIKLAQAQPTKRQAAIELTQAITRELRQQLKQHPEKRHLRKLHSVLKAHRYLNANVNPRLCLEYLFIQLSV